MRIGVVYTTAVVCLGLLYIAESCNVEIIVTDNPTNITSPGYPTRVYPNKLNCWWKVVAANSDNDVVVEVVDSSIESSPNCIFDSLAVYDGLNSSSPRLAKLCGTQKGAYISTGSSMYILFTTDSSIGHKGFLLMISASPKCGGDLTATPDSATLLSPGYPNRYLNNMRCTWVITAENENDTVVLQTRSSHTEQHVDCSYDSVTVYNGNNTSDDILGTYCGTDTPVFQSSKNQLTIYFFTDSSNVYSGFKMFYKSVEADNCNRTFLTGSLPLYFVSPGYPDEIYNDLECEWTIFSRHFGTVSLLPKTMDIEDSEDCANASVTVYSGVKTRELGSFCGNSTRSYTSDTYLMTVVFNTGDIAFGKGFKIGYENTRPPPTNCGSNNRAAVTAPQYLQSPGYPVAYGNNDRCLWTIQAASSFMMVRIVVLDSQLENSQTCRFDYVKVYDGRYTYSNLLQTWCGSMKPTVQSTQQYMLLDFKSNDMFVYKGFRLKYFETSEPYTCGGSLSTGSLPNTLTSPGYPNNYKINLNCVWTISTTYNNIKIDVINSDIEQSSDCSYDYVQVNDGSFTSSPTLGKFCGTQTPTFYSTGQTVTVTFHSDSSLTSTGFELQYSGGTFSPCSEQDLVAFSFSDHDFTSPNYPFHYPSNADCTWRIDTEDSDYVVSIDVLSSDIEYSTNCDYDYVEAFDGYDDSYTSLGSWCGSSLPNKHSSGRYMFIKFHSDGSTTGTGFKISYTAESKDDFYTSNVGAIVGGTIGGTVVLAIILVLIGAASKKSSRPVVTRVQDNRVGNVYAVTQGQYETTVAPAAAFQPPPAYCKVVTGEQRRIIGAVGTAGAVAQPPPYPQTGVTADTAPIIYQQQNP